MRARHGDFPQWFSRKFQLQPEHVQVVDAFIGEALPAPADLANAVITGWGSTVTERADWREHCAGCVRSALDAELLLLGVGFRHQLFAQALGGRID